MVDKEIDIGTKFRSVVFFIFLVAAIALATKATLAGFEIYSSTTFSIIYFALFGVGLLFTKKVYLKMFKACQYAVLAMTVAMLGMSVFLLLHKL